MSRRGEDPKGWVTGLRPPIELGQVCGVTTRIEITHFLQAFTLETNAPSVNFFLKEVAQLATATIGWVQGVTLTEYRGNVRMVSTG